MKSNKVVPQKEAKGKSDELDKEIHQLVESFDTTLPVALQDANNKGTTPKKHGSRQVATLSPFKSEKEDAVEEPEDAAGSLQDVLGKTRGAGSIRRASVMAAHSAAQIARKVQKVQTKKRASINILRRMDSGKQSGKYRFIFSPTSTYRQYWDLIIAGAVVYMCWLIPVLVSMSWWQEGHAVSTLNAVLDGFFVIDIILNFRTGIIRYGEVIMNPRQIAMNYFRTWFFIDLIATFPPELFLKADAASIGSTRKSIKLLKYVKLPKLLRIGQLVRKFKLYQRYQGSTTILFAFMFSLHLLGCTWVMVMDPCDDVVNEDGTLVPDELIDPYCRQENVFLIYWLGIYYMACNMIGIASNYIYEDDNPLCGGYKGQVIATSALIFNILTSIVGLVFVALFFGSAVFVVQSWNRAGYAFRKRMDAIQYEMDYLNLPSRLRARIRTYYDYLWLNQRGLRETLVLLQDGWMSEPLRRQIAIFTYKDLLTKIPLFRNANDNMLGLVSLQVRMIIYMPGDTVITKGQYGRELYIVAKGQVTVLKSNPTEVDVVLSETAFFGEIALLMEIERTRSVVAITVCELCILDKAAFDAILAEFPTFATEMKRLILQRSTVPPSASQLEQIDKKIADRKKHWSSLQHKAKTLIVPSLALMSKSPVHETIEEHSGEMAEQLSTFQSEVDRRMTVMETMLKTLVTRTSLVGSDTDMSALEGLSEGKGEEEEKATEELQDIESTEEGASSCDAYACTVPDTPVEVENETTPTRKKVGKAVPPAYSVETPAPATDVENEKRGRRVTRHRRGGTH